MMVWHQGAVITIQRPCRHPSSSIALYLAGLGLRPGSFVPAPKHGVLGDMRELDPTSCSIVICSISLAAAHSRESGLSQHATPEQPDRLKQLPIPAELSFLWPLGSLRGTN